MSNYSIYLRTEDNNILLREAKNLGLTPLELLKKRLENSIQTEKNAVLQNNINELQNKIDAVFMLLELLAKEIGYTSGATRAGSAHIPKAVNEGIAIENQLKNSIKTLRTRFEKEGAEVSL